MANDPDSGTADPQWSDPIRSTLDPKWPGTLKSRSTNQEEKPSEDSIPDDDHDQDPLIGE